MKSSACCFALAAALAACSTGTPSGDVQEPSGTAPAVRAHGLEFSAQTRVLESFPIQLHTTVTMRNAGGSARHIEAPGGCPVLLQAARAEDPGRIRWNQAGTIVCTLQLRLVDLQPGDTALFVGRTDARAILGDSLPDGRYLLRAALTFNDTSVVMPAGSVQLAVPR